MDFDTLKFKEDENSPKHKQLADFIYGIAGNVSNPSNASQIHQFNLGIGLKSNKIEPRACERSGLVTCTSENHERCNISTISPANESHATSKNYPEDMIFSKRANSSKNLETPSEYAWKQLYKSGKDRKSFLQPIDHPGFRNRSPAVSRRYKCNFLDETYSRSSCLSKNVRSHTADKPYQCTECDKSSEYPYKLRDHSYKHTGDSPYSCEECGKRFGDKSTFRKHSRTHTGEKPHSCNVEKNALLPMANCFYTSTPILAISRIHVPNAINAFLTVPI
ncbi:hypothetical protein CEXT_222931 [Caerostris extrusa]|uniref:C2H2-type domain-containing protein n=1 Tax=Caerostris extrusa TaxID=172846 RepID=A0AAV4U769_CAEEX|nr:hypothetical protein CEXT_222931 [Caerostris extrusa]